MAPTTIYTYHRVGQVVYRQPEGVSIFELEVHDGGEWQPATGDRFPSEQDYDSMRVIAEAEAKARLDPRRGGE